MDYSGSFGSAITQCVATDPFVPLLWRTMSTNTSLSLRHAQ